MLAFDGGDCGELFDGCVVGDVPAFVAIERVCEVVVVEVAVLEVVETWADDANVGGEVEEEVAL